MINSIWDLISCSEGLLFLAPVVLYFNTYDFKHIQKVLVLLATMLFGEFIKFNVIGDESPRPAQATNCNMFCNNGAQGGKPGMPSTHMAVAAAFSTLYFPVGPISETIKLPIVSGFVLLIIAMAAARYNKFCHTPNQIIVGTLFGILCGLVGRFFIYGL